MVLCDAVKGREPEMGSEAVRKLLAAVDTHIPQPVRELDKPFYLPIEQVFSIAGKFIPRLTGLYECLGPCHTTWRQSSLALCP